MKVTFPANIVVDAATRKRTEDFMQLIVSNKSSSRIHRLINQGICLEATRTIHQYESCNPLHLAAAFGDKAVIDKLLAKGADIEAPQGPTLQIPSLGLTPLHFAVAFNNDVAIDTLLARGANREARDNEGNVPLHLAVENGLKSAFDTLLRNGVNIEARNNNQSTPLHIAVNRANLMFAESLVRHGADIEARDSYQHSPLYSAAVRQNGPVFDFLLSKGANINILSADDKNPAQYRRISSGNIECWREAYRDFYVNRTAPESAEELYHLLNVYPLKDPHSPVDKAAHLRQIFLHADWKNRDAVTHIVTCLQQDGTDVHLAEALEHMAIAHMAKTRGATVGAGVS